VRRVHLDQFERFLQAFDGRRQAASLDRDFAAEWQQHAL
jgi:hypothetical protein